MDSCVGLGSESSTDFDGASGVVENTETGALPFVEDVVRLPDGPRLESVGRCSDSFAVDNDGIGGVPGFESENGRAVIGGSFALVRSCSIVAIYIAVCLNVPSVASKTRE